MTEKTTTTNKATPRLLKFADWFSIPLDEASEDRGVTATEILVRAGAKDIGVKIPVGYKFRGKNKS